MPTDPKISKMQYFSFVFVLCILLASFGNLGCDDDNSVCPKRGPMTPPPDMESTPDTLSLGGQAFILKCDLWRDFQPISPPDGKPLIAFIRLFETDSLSIEPNLQLTHLWVVFGSEFWSTSFSNEQMGPGPDYEIKRVARNGPKWGPDVIVDVIAQVAQKDVGCYYIRADDVLIFMTMK